MRKLWCVWTILALVMYGVQSPAWSQPLAPSEYQLKAAFLYNFAKFVEWSPGTLERSRTLTICVLGEDPFGSALDEVLQGKTIHGRKFVISRGDAVTDPTHCQILFISSSERERIGRIQEQLKGANVLTVGEVDRFTQRGGIINFIRVDNKIRFEINPDAAQRAGLKISSKLLRLAAIVRDEG